MTLAAPESLSGEVWPIHPKPLDDELLSSWMIRIARAYGVKPSSFWNQFWPMADISFAIIDHGLKEGLLRLLSGKMSVSYETTANTTLLPFASADHMLLRATRLRFCPCRLAQDVTPYFRRRWQMLPMLVCEVHSILLLAACQQCRERLHPELVPIEAASIASCYRCGHDLRQSTTHPIPRSKKYERWLAFQGRLLKLMDGHTPGS